MMRKVISFFWCFIVSLIFPFMVNGAFAAIYHPGGNSGNGNVLALIAAIEAANASKDDDVIDLDGLIFILTDPYPATLNGLPVIASASDSGKLSLINGAISRFSSTDFRFLYISGGAIVSLTNITLENGYFGSTQSNPGGAIYNNGYLNIINCALYHNTASSNGGAIYNDYGGTIGYLEKSVFSNNLSTMTFQPPPHGPPRPPITFFPPGGAIFNNGTIQRINNTTFNNNNGSGAIYNDHGLIDNITNSTFSNNSSSSGNGGAIDNEGNGTINNIGNSTFVGNIASSGGAIFNNSGSIGSVVNNTIFNNTATLPVYGAGGIDNSFGGDGYPNIIASLTSNIIAGNIGAYPDFKNNISVTTEGYNLFSSTPSGLSPLSSTDIIQTNAGSFLGPLQNNGGVSFTVALLPGSLAINSGHNPYSFTYDQRGASFFRVCGGVIDIGSFELQTCN